ncbi:MAG: cob(I)yrinic acid a,c-diamide adenosyltransferase [Betaproteobacteria bacterium]|jgi:cob(I)alamin adenosyltransferase|nr:cob(I)yrinic acid a,c-diamide adenosyltransferase [Betaproteobacteria bacterium]
MGKRLTSIVTRTGDNGTTGLGDGSRLSKTAPRVMAMGDVDELNSTIGMLLAIGIGGDEELETPTLLRSVQQDLFDLGGELSIPGYTLLKSERIAALDEWLKKANAKLPRLEEFILPGGSLAAAQAHVARTVCRRAERSVVALAEANSINAAVLQYLNRLSDLLFVLARLLNRLVGGIDEQWDRSR